MPLLLGRNEDNEIIGKLGGIDLRDQRRLRHSQMTLNSLWRWRVAGIASDILSDYPRDVELLREALPPRCSVRDWELLYSTRRSGMSMHTFFRQVHHFLHCRDLCQNACRKSLRRVLVQTAIAVK
jgi:hypothetical protein